MHVRRSLAVFLAVCLANVNGGRVARKVGSQEDQSAAADEDSVNELRSQLQESQQEDDTNEAIIESLLGKQAKLVNQTQDLQRQLAVAKRNLSTAPKVDVAEENALKQHASLLQEAVQDLTGKLSAKEKMEASEHQELIAERARNDQLAKRNKELETEAKSKMREGRELRKSLTKTKLALLQSMNAATDTDFGARNDGSAVTSSSNVHSLAEKLFSETASLNSQVQTLTKKLVSEKELAHLEKTQLAQALSENQELRQKAHIATSAAAEHEALQDSYSRVDSALSQTLHQLRREEKELLTGKLAADQGKSVQQIASLQADNARLKSAGSEVMQKYDLLQRAFVQEQQKLRYLATQLPQSPSHAITGRSRKPRIFFQRANRRVSLQHRALSKAKVPEVPKSMKTAVHAAITTAVHSAKVQVQADSKQKAKFLQHEMKHKPAKITAVDKAAIHTANTAVKAMHNAIHDTVAQAIKEAKDHIASRKKTQATQKKK